MPLNDTAKALIARFPLGFVATVTPDGWPAVSPKGTFLVLDDDTIGFGEIRSPGTMRNLAQLAQTEVNFIDQWTRKGIRVRGTTRVVTSGVEFDALIGKWRAVWGDLVERINALVLIRAEHVKPMTTPPYDDGVSEADMIALYKQKFSEIYP